MALTHTLFVLFMSLMGSKMTLETSWFQGLRDSHSLRNVSPSKLESLKSFSEHLLPNCFLFVKQLPKLFGYQFVASRETRTRRRAKFWFRFWCKNIDLIETNINLVCFWKLRPFSMLLVLPFTLLLSVFHWEELSILKLNYPNFWSNDIH